MTGYMLELMAPALGRTVYCLGPHEQRLGKPPEIPARAGCYEHCVPLPPTLLPPLLWGTTAAAAQLGCRLVRIVHVCFRGTHGGQGPSEGMLTHTRLQAFATLQCTCALCTPHADFDSTTPVGQQVHSFTPVRLGFGKGMA
jgi:hypothetical protein